MLMLRPQHRAVVGCTGWGWDDGRIQGAANSRDLLSYGFGDITPINPHEPVWVRFGNLGGGIFYFCAMVRAVPPPCSPRGIPWA